MAVQVHRQRGTCEFPRSFPLVPHTPGDCTEEDFLFYFNFEIFTISLVENVRLRLKRKGVIWLVPSSRRRCARHGLEPRPS